MTGNNTRAAISRDAFERIEPDTPQWAAYFANHIQRYMFATERLKEIDARHVLDVACGVGYGAQYLAEAAGVTVVAADRDAGALRIARARFAHPAVTVVQDDCHALAGCQRLGPFHAVVSFETVEHLPRPAEFLARCRELLASDGLLIASTPNGGADVEPRCVHHEREYTAVELVLLLDQAGFRDVAIYGQRFTPLGELRRELRAELNLLRFNPFIRAGQWLQVVRGRARPLPALPERLADFEIVPFRAAEECDALGASGPFVLIALGRR